MGLNFPNHMDGLIASHRVTQFTAWLFSDGLGVKGALGAFKRCWLLGMGRGQDIYKFS